MSDAAIRVDGLSKRFRLGEQERYKALRDTLPRLLSSIFQKRTRRDSFLWALKDVSFEINQGDAVGIIGRNGAGKSTLLKILSRITEPTTGHGRVRGRLASLLEVGTGFHPELTGRENIYLNGAILGMRKHDIARNFDGIVDFADVEKFIDTPVKYYSSGMYVRLAFAVAAHLEPDILLVDEVLAVGDAAFQKKCLGKMGEVARGGRTVLFVSHNLGTVTGLTKRCLYLEAGKLLDYGESNKIVARYLTDSAAFAGDGSSIEYYRRDRIDSPIRVTGLAACCDNQPNSYVSFGSDFSIMIQLRAEKEIVGANATVILKDIHGQRAVLLFSWDSNFFVSMPRGEKTVRLDVRGLPLAPGRYFCDVGINQTSVTPAYDVIIDFPIFEVINDGRIVHWQERPWGGIHWEKVEWQNQAD
jgi:homopolymeric O-antigen transport system ATP-binding protein